MLACVPFPYFLLPIYPTNDKMHPKWKILQNNSLTCPDFTRIESEASHGLQAVTRFESARASDPSCLTGVFQAINLTLSIKGKGC